jgi:hypothetical protein
LREVYLSEILKLALWAVGFSSRSGTVLLEPMPLSLYHTGRKAKMRTVRAGETVDTRTTWRQGRAAPIQKENTTVEIWVILSSKKQHTDSNIATRIIK